ncbi:MAG: actin-binding WH2 domain-containing protein [Gemmatimonadota bacterium]|nr:MAG: actin-binding WH2 domain-containing protein [Gemmatimonadota bacterium]
MVQSDDRPGRDASSYHGFLTALLSDRERLFEEVVEGVELTRKLRFSVCTLLVLTAFYGLAAGAYAGPLQALSAAVKLPVLIVVTLVICFPAFFVVQILVGSRLRLSQVLVLVLAALDLTAILLAAFVPVTVFFLITGANYYFLQLLHVLAVLVAGVFGMYALHEGLAVVCEQRGVYPRKALTIMRAWALLFAFVGIQLAWNLRPFLGDRGEPFRVFRSYEGNFYAAIVYSVNKLLKGEGQSSQEGPDERSSVIEDLLAPPADSVEGTGRR